MKLSLGLYRPSMIGLQSTSKCRSPLDVPKHRYNPSLDPTPNLWLNQNNKHTEGLTLVIMRTEMKGMTEAKRIGGKGIDV